MNNPQVGGVYPVKGREGLSFRVLAVDDGEVKIIHVQRGYEFAEMTIYRPYFEEVTFPEDRGPIPELVAALKLALDYLYDYVPHATQAPVISAVENALAKAEVTAVPDSEEVAA